MMSQAWRRDRLAEFCSDSGIDEAGTSFLQSVVRLVDSSGVLDDNVLSNRTASLTVPWAVSIFEAFKDGRLRGSHAKGALESARTACDEFRIVFSELPTVAGWEARLSFALSQPSLSTVPSLDINLSDVAIHQNEITRKMILGADPNITHSLAKTLASEVAVGLISRYVDMDNFISQLEQIEPGQPNLREVLAELLLHPDADFNVIVPVEGALNFESLELLATSAHIRQVFRGEHRAFMGWDAAGQEADNFIREHEARLNPTGAKSIYRRQYAYINATVAASDIRGAGIKGRQTVVEILDQYVAGHPFVQFSIDSTVCVNPAGKNYVQIISLRPPTENSVSPLTVPWPSTLRQAMRMTHLMRDALAPLTRIALTWVMIESAGLATREIEAISRALALTRLRQSAFMPYRLLVQDSIDMARGKSYSRRAVNLQKSAWRLTRHASKAKLPLDVAAQSRAYAVKAELLADFYILLDRKFRILASRRRKLLSEFDAKINPIMANTSRHNGHLADMSEWLKLLRTDWTKIDHQEAALLRQLMDSVSNPVKAAITDLSRMAQSGTLAAAKLAQDQTWTAEVLKAFNTARNLNLHSGTFNSEGDVALGELAMLIADTLFETWSIWYAPGLTHGLNAVGVIQMVSDRYDRCLGFLQGGGSITDIDLFNVTAPKWQPAQGV